MKWTPKSVGAVMLTTTVCIVLLLMFIRFMMYPPGTVLDETRDKMFQLVTFIAGIVSGWVLHGDVPHVEVPKVEENKEPDDNEPQKPTVPSSPSEPPKNG